MERFELEPHSSRDKSGLTVLEREALFMLTSGDSEILATLRRQVSSLRVVHREYSGVGFFTTFDVEQSPRVRGEPSFHLGDIIAETPSLDQGIGFDLSVKDGRMDRLEAFTYGEPWPQVLSDLKLSFLRPSTGSASVGLKPASSRDMKLVKREMHMTERACRRSQD